MSFTNQKFCGYDVNHTVVYFPFGHQRAPFLHTEQLHLPLIFITSDEHFQKRSWNTTDNKTFKLTNKWKRFTAYYHGFQSWFSIMVLYHNQAGAHVKLNSLKLYIY